MVIGTKLRDGLRLPGLRLRPEPEQCTDCKTCTKNCPMSLDVKRDGQARLDEGLGVHPLRPLR